MSYPNQPPQQYTGYPPPGYTQMPPQPGYPQAVPQPPAYPAQPPAQPAQPLPNGSLDDFFGQPNTGGGASWSFKDKPPGTFYEGFVEREVTNADIEAQTIPGTNTPATYRDGRIKYAMRVPMITQPSEAHPEGKATWYVQGQARGELARAMKEASAPEGAPEPGAWVRVTLVNRKPARTPGFNPSNEFRVEYRRPQGAPPAAPAAQPPGQVQHADIMSQPENSGPPAGARHYPPQPAPPAAQAPPAAAPPAPPAAATPGSEDAFRASLTEQERQDFDAMTAEQRVLFRQMKGQAA